MALRLVSNAPERIDLGDGDWLDVRSDISKKQFNTLLKSLPEGFGDDNSFTPGESDDFVAAIFEAFILDWSLVDEAGEAVPATRENYDNLTREAATIVDTAIMEHFNAQSATDEESTKSDESSGVEG